MKAKEKHVGTKAQIRAMKEKERRIATAIFLAFILLIVIFSAYFTYNFLNQPQNQTTNPTSNPESPQPKAIIFDQLSLTFPNQTFVQTATNILTTANYTVYYYEGNQVTVDLYRSLPARGYSLIVLRVHAALGAGEQPPVALFTAEPYSNTRYVPEQLNDQLIKVAYGIVGQEISYYFAIWPNFVKYSMNGKFQNTTIIMMGCDGFKYMHMAEAFIEKGAKAYISWNSKVSASHTDQATIQLLKHLITEKQTIKQAIAETMEEVGPDPSYQSILCSLGAK